MIWTTGSVMAFLIILFAIIVWIKMVEARRQARIIKANYLTIKAEELYKTDKTKGIRIAQAAYDLLPKNPSVHLLRLLHNIFYDQVNRCYCTNFEHDRWVSSAVFSADGNQILTASGDRTAKLWTVAGEFLAVFKHDNAVNSAVFSPDCSQILTASWDRTAKLWTVAGESLAVFKHDNTVNSAVFSPDGSQILTASIDETAKQWTVAGESLAVFKYDNAVHSAVFSSDGNQILTASWDGTAKLWLTPNGIYKWLQTAPIYQLSDHAKREYGIIE